jgi:REP element-mobilizing transposase RayT
MTYARKTQICLQDTPYYHLVGRCVRRAWLCGFDQYSGRDYSHRKQWVLERLRLLTSMCAINVCAYAILSNHYHLVVHVDQAKAKTWTMREVVERWTSLFSAPPMVERWLTGEAGPGECEAAETTIRIWRARLYDVSWFMKCLNEHLARRANAEDGCTGHFWQSRFKSQALLDDPALITAMVYVDLNPIRAGIAGTPEESEFTSIYERIQELRRRPSAAADVERKTHDDLTTRIPLVPFKPDARDDEIAIPYRLEDYLRLLDWTGRAIDPKRASVEKHLPSIIQRLNIDADAWRLAMRPRGNVFGRAIGRLDHLRLHARTLGQSWVRGLRQSRRLYPA